MLFLLGPGSHEEARKGTPNIPPGFFIYLCFPDLIGSSQSYLKSGFVWFAFIILLYVRRSHGNNIESNLSGLMPTHWPLLPLRSLRNKLVKIYSDSHFASQPCWSNWFYLDLIEQMDELRLTKLYVSFDFIISMPRVPFRVRNNLQNKVPRGRDN